MSVQEKLGVLFVSGVRHAALYLPVFLAQSQVNIIGICEEPAASRQAQVDCQNLAGQFNIPVLGDPSEVLSRSDIGLVVVCSEPVRHARLAIQALQAGKHVLVDKPLGINLEQAGQVWQAAKTSPGQLTVIHRLFSPAVQRARRLIDADQIGLTLNLDLEFLSNGTRFAQAVERPELVADPALSGGGEILNFLVYPVDYLRYLTGLEVLEVFAEAGSLFFEPHARFGVEDVGVISLMMENQVTATITVGRVPFAPAAGPIASTMRLLGSHGFLTVDESQPGLEFWGSDAAAAARHQPIGGEAGTVAFETEIQEFIRDILENRQPHYTVADAWATMSVIDAVYQSLARGLPATVERFQPPEG